MVDLVVLTHAVPSYRVALAMARNSVGNDSRTRRGRVGLMVVKRCLTGIGGAAILSLLLVLGSGSVAAQEGEATLTSVCVQGFEQPIRVMYLTDEQIADIEQQVDDPGEPPGLEIVRYPDPETGSCATENGELMDYDPDLTTPICVPSGLRGEGPLVVQFAPNHYLPAYGDVILADPETGACSDGESDDPVDNDTVDDSAANNGTIADGAADAGNEVDTGDVSATNDGTTDDGVADADDEAGEATELPNTGVGVTTQQQGLGWLSAVLAGGASLMLAGGVAVSRRGELRK